MEKAFESCWGNRSSPLRKILHSGSSNYYRMESTAFGKTPLMLNGTNIGKKVSRKVGNAAVWGQIKSK